MIEMGSYYRAEPYGLIKTVCKAYNSDTGDSMVVFSKVEVGGYAGEMKVMPESTFKSTFLRK